MGEFEIIDRYFRPLTMGQAGAANLRDDAAVLAVRSGCELVVTSDTLNEGVHFLPDTVPEDIARKALRVNLSDLAAMGADALCYQLNLAFARPPEGAWLESFTAGLLEDNRAFNVFCSGGDTTSIKGDCLSISITAMGSVPAGQAVRRSGAKDGDVLVVTGAIGAAVLGLAVLQGGYDTVSYADAVARYVLPQPRLGCAALMRRYVHAAADVSDGLFADAGHIMRASGLGLEIDVHAMPLTDAVRRGVEQGIITREQAVKGGDDYELVMAVGPENFENFKAGVDHLDVGLSVIGRFVSGHNDIMLIPAPDFKVDLSRAGWTHF